MTNKRKCGVCGTSLEVTDAGYCSDHTRADKNLKHAYAVWKRAYGQITAEDFLNRLCRLAETGERAKELANYYLQNPGRWHLD